MLCICHDLYVRLHAQLLLQVIKICQRSALLNVILHYSLMVLILFNIDMKNEVVAPVTQQRFTV